MAVESPAPVPAGRDHAAGAADRTNFKPIGPVRLTIACAVLLSVMVVASGGFFLFNIHNRIQTVNERDLSNIALVLAKQFEQFFTAVERVQIGLIQDIAGAVDAADGERLLSGHDVYLKLRDKAAGMPYVGALTIFEAQGRLINFSRQWPTPDINVADRDFFKVFQSNPDLKFFVGEAVYNRANGSRVVHFARKIPGPSGEFLGVITAAVELQYLQKYFSEISLEPGSGVTLFHEDGMVLARYPVLQSVIGRRFPNALSLKLVADADHGIGVSTGAMDGHVRMIASRRIGNSPLVVATTRTVATIYADWWKLLAFVTSISALTVAAIAAFAFLFIRQFRSYQSLVRARTERQKAEQLRQQSLQLDVALNNMTQGLVMFDSSERVVLCNQRYVAISGLSSDFMQPGRTVREILEARHAQGSFSPDIDQYRRELREDIADGKTKSLVMETSAGRWQRIVNVPMPGGGWVATHEDITDQVISKTVIEKQKLQLDAALGNMSQGLSMFDKQQRLIVCNKRYAELYELNDELIRPGNPLREILERQIAIGNVPEDRENYVTRRLGDVSVQKPYKLINRLHDGRLVSVVHRPLEDGGWVTTHEDVTEAMAREESFRLLFDRNPVPMWVIDRDNLRFLAVNDAAISCYGYSREQFMSMAVTELRPFEERERFAQFLRTLSNNQLVENIGQHVTSDGRTIDVAVYSQTLTYAGHDARLTAIHDITKAKQVERDLSRTQKFLDTIIENIPAPILVKDVPSTTRDASECRYSLVNRASEELFGISRDKIVGKTAHEFYPKERADFIVAENNDTLRSDQPIVLADHVVSTPANGLRFVTARSFTVRDDDHKPQYLLTVLEDVTERKRAEQRIARMAHHDSLTDLPNRATFNDAMQAAIEQAEKSAEQFVVLSLDLDGFKEANDTYGHSIGDALLREVAQRLQSAAEKSFVARIGGDEFTLIVTGGLQSATAVAQRLLDALEEDFVIDDRRIRIGATIGAAIYPRDGDNAKTLMINADIALYRAKTETRGAVLFFNTEMGDQLRERRALHVDLRSAIERNELLLHYQPQNKISGETIGFEALARWECPRRGLVSPDVFIPIAEKEGLIVPIGEWVLREACREAASWPRPLTIAVNISPIQFRNDDLPKSVHSILLETGLLPGRLELEITEGVLIEDFSRAISILSRLKALGVRIALDDFGSGYSSLSYLHSFSFDKIKIDRAFIGDLEYNHHSMAIVRAVIDLGHSLRIPILAEGVESVVQHAMLLGRGCDEVQGYLTGRPLPIEEYARLVGRERDAEQLVAEAV
jgi:diguanylate cyclase (GGDEF)-like protein/PAS domain S-box-containing protein